MLRRDVVLHWLAPTASEFDRQGFPDLMQDVINRARGRVKREYVEQNQQRRVVPAENGTGWVKRISSATPTEAD